MLNATKQTLIIIKALTLNEVTLNVLSVGVLFADVTKDFLADPVSWLVGGSIAWLNFTRGIKNLSESINNRRNNKKNNG